MDEHSQEEHIEEQTGPDNLFARLYRPGPLIALFSIAFFALVGLGYFLLTEETPPPPVIAEAAYPAPDPLIYEEDTSSQLEDMVKEVDLAIIESMRGLNLKMGELDLLDVEIRQHEGDDYHYQVLKLPAVTDKNVFYETLQVNMGKRVPEARLEVQDKDGLTVAINAIPTHHLLLETIPLVLPKPLKRGPQLAIVIDDIGQNMPVLKGLVALDFPVTLAVWPNASYTRKSVEIVTQSRRDLIIHFPMEPKGYPRYNPGDDALFVSMTAEDIKERIAENVAQIPEAIGVNNHMGSKFTGYSTGMKVALAEFKKHGLFFLDSLTTPKSVARNTASNANIPFYERDIFIDNVKDVEAIVLQLKKAESVALKEGRSIAIGHPYKETLSALKAWSKGRNTSIELIPLSQLKPE